MLYKGLTVKKSRYLLINYQKIEEVPAGAERLFKVMMRLEFALKEIGFARLRPNGSVEVDWNRFAKHGVSQNFIDRLNDNGRCQTLLTLPPKKQTVSASGYLMWEDSSPPSSKQDFIGALCRVRNNLFHGGKSGDPDIDRNEALISDALVGIEELLQDNADLHQMFAGEY